MITRSISTAVGILMGSLITLAVYAQEQTTQPAPENPSTAYAMNRTVNPEVFANLMKQMMEDPMGMMAGPMGMMANPASTCLHCHGRADLERFSASFGPMMQPGTPAARMNPSMYGPMTMRPMNPETYTDWYNAWMKKFGGAMQGDNAGESQ